MKPGHFPICCVAATHVNQLTIIEIRIERGAHENASFIQVLTGCYSGKGIIFCLTLLQISAEWFSSFNSLSSFTPSSFSHTHFHKNWLKDGICEHFFLKDYFWTIQIGLWTYFLENLVHDWYCQHLHMECFHLYM